MPPAPPGTPPGPAAAADQGALGRFHLIRRDFSGARTAKIPVALEVYNGRDTQRVHKQLRKHLQAQAEGAVAAAYGLALPYRVLLTFESEAAGHRPRPRGPPVRRGQAVLCLQHPRSHQTGLRPRLVLLRRAGGGDFLEGIGPGRRSVCVVRGEQHQLRMSLTAAQGRRGCRTRSRSWCPSDDCRRGDRAVLLSSDLGASELAEQSETSIAGTWCWQKEAVP